jgi:centromere protein I
MGYRLELSRRVGNEPSLVGLIRVYKDYYPDVIVGDAANGRASVFMVCQSFKPFRVETHIGQHPNPEWRKRLLQIQEEHAQRAQDALPIRQQAFRVARRGLNGTKRGKVSVLPEVHTSNAQEVCLRLAFCRTLLILLQTSITLEEIDNVTDFIQKLEKIDLPNQLVSVIGDPLLQNLLQLKSNENIKRRIDNWLTAFFEDQLESGGYAGSTLLDMLVAIKDYANFTKVSLQRHSPHTYIDTYKPIRHYLRLVRDICRDFWENGMV